MKERNMVDGPNMYAYARNDPVNHSGKQADYSMELVWGGLIHVMGHGCYSDCRDKYSAGWTGYIFGTEIDPSKKDEFYECVEGCLETSTRIQQRGSGGSPGLPGHLLRLR